MRERPTPTTSTPWSTGIRVDWVSLLKLFLAVLAIWAIWRLWTGIEVLLVAVLLAVAISPIVDRLERWGLSRP